MGTNNWSECRGAAKMGALTTHTMRNVYLTGVSGFFGGQLLRDLTDADDQFGKIYLPVRAKKNKTGQARFEDIVGSLGGTCVYLDSDAPIPADTNVVILNAYSISFMGDVKDTLEQNVVPILGLLDQCTNLSDIKSVLIVSTAYVQPYLPFKRCKGPIPCHASQDPEATFNAVLKGEMTWDQIQSDKRNHPHTSVNAYVYSKTLLEHVVLKRYQGTLPLVIFRPSMISVSSDGEYGSKFTPPCATALLAASRVGRVFSGTANADHVHVDQVSALLLQSIMLPEEQLLNEPAFVLATGNNAIKPKNYENQMRGTSGCYTLFLERPVTGATQWLVFLLRWIELSVYWVVLGAKIAERIGKVYQNYDHFLTHTFDFEPNLPIEIEEYHTVMRKWLVNNPIQNKKAQLVVSGRNPIIPLTSWKPGNISTKWGVVLLPLMASMIMCCFLTIIL